ncbi:MAG TPA: hypothetical protein VK183_01815 [Flavobacterium sp.]|nr:hypothetical protein [Flavobacterium sp.]
MTKINSSIFFLLAACCLSCRTMEKNSIIGNYSLKENHFSGEITLQDSTFRYGCDIYENRYTSEGKWRMQHNRLVLNSFENYRHGFLKVEEGVSTNSFIKLYDRDSRPIEHCEILVNNTYSTFTDEHGFISTNDIPGGIKTITVFYIGINENARTYVPKNKNSNTFIIRAFNFDNGKLFFSNEMVRVGENVLILRGKKFHKTN